MKSAISHGASFLAGLGLGFLLATKACPPTPAPAGQPAPEAPKVEVKEEIQAPSKTETKIEIKSEAPKISAAEANGAAK